MKVSLLSVLALFCTVYIASANYAYYGGYGAPSASGFGDNTLLMFIGFMFILTLLFTRLTSNTTNVINLTAPSG